MKDSLQSLLNQFPFFFNKSSTSNFYKSQSVTNKQFQNIYQALFDVVESFRLGKNCLIWKEQSAPYDYTIHFVACFPYLKSVTIMKNDDVIYSDTFSYDDNVDTFNYSYNGSTLDDVGVGEVAEIIPQHQFKLIVETFEENKIVKGFPENDNHQGNEFDHDESLDEIGALHNIPRRQYLLVTEDLYPATEPPFCDRSSEDDYHYMQRILEYMVRYHVTPLPVLEVWKDYGIESRMENREKLLIKTFDVDQRGTDWTPAPWEHKDRFCSYSNMQGTYFFIQCSTNHPTRKQNVQIQFLLVDGLGENIGDDTYRFDIYFNDELIQENYSEWYFTITPSMLSEIDETTITVICKNSSRVVVGSAEIIMRIRSCQDASIFVDVVNGSDRNDGRTPETALKTIQAGCNKVVANDLIAVLEGTYVITSPVLITNSCTIMCCEEVTLQNTQSNKFFNVSVGKELSLQDITLKPNSNTTHDVSDEQFINKNSESFLTVIAGKDANQSWGDLCADLITSLTYSDHVLGYEFSEMNEVADLDGVIYDLEYDESDHQIKYKVFEPSGEELTPEEKETLRTAITGIVYENGKIKCELLGDRL